MGCVISDKLRKDLRVQMIIHVRLLPKIVVRVLLKDFLLPAVFRKQVQYVFKVQMVKN